MTTATDEIVARFDRSAPRYTSYPTVPEWSAAVGPEDYACALEDRGRGGEALSLYVHIPFCESLCAFCGCTMNVRPAGGRHADAFLDDLDLEVDRVARGLGRRIVVSQVHWGGGSPSFLTDAQTRRLSTAIREAFHLAPDFDWTVELDPRRVAEDRIRLLRELGCRRVSLGVQDFEPRVMRAVERHQSFDDVRRVVAWCRGAEVRSINFDLIYGLPHQDAASFDRTVTAVLRLRPDRIALYSFAYLPRIKRHQRKIDPRALPDGRTKLTLFLEARRRFLRGGYRAVAMDHFALPGDDLARAEQEGRLRRTFMGYTVLPHEDYIGLGPSAIGFLGGLYVQNAKILADYRSAVRSGGLATVRGHRLSPDDRRRRWVIERWMCRFRVDRREYREIFGEELEVSIPEAGDHIRRCRSEGLLKDDGRVLAATEMGRLFIRNICLGFDAYGLRHRSSEFSRTV